MTNTNCALQLVLVCMLLSPYCLAKWLEYVQIVDAFSHTHSLLSRRMGIHRNTCLYKVMSVFDKQFFQSLYGQNYTP